MVTKVVTEHDVDNVTIIINSENKLQAQLPDTTSGEVVIEEVPNVTTANDVVTLDGTMRKITKLGKVSGTEWLVFQLDNPLPPKPTIQKNIRLEFYDDVGVNSGDGVNFSHSGKVRVITEDGSPFTPNGDPVYVDYPYLEMRMEFAGSNGVVSSYVQIDFIMMTYRAEVSYNDVQMRSSLTRVLSWSESFSAEHEDAFYTYHITDVSGGDGTVIDGGTDTPTDLPTFNISSRGNDNEVVINGNTVTNSEGVVRFEFHADMLAYAKAGYKVYGVIKDNGTTIYEAPLNDEHQRIALGSGNIQYSEIDNGFMGGIIGKTLNSTNLTAHVYLMNDVGDKVYPANQPDGFVDNLRI